MGNLRRQFHPRGLPFLVVGEYPVPTGVADGEFPAPTPDVDADDGISISYL